MIDAIASLLILSGALMALIVAIGLRRLWRAGDHGQHHK